MIFELPDIFFGSHPKKEMASQPPQVRQYGFIKKLEKALSQADFSKIRSYLFRCNKPTRKKDALASFFFLSVGTGGTERPPEEEGVGFERDRRW